MRIVTISLFLICFVAISSGIASDGNCRNNPIVQTWINERDELALDMVKKWISGEGKEVTAPLLALIWTKEMNVAAKCRHDVDFLKQYSLFNGADLPRLSLDTTPTFLLHKLLGNDYLSPSRQFPEEGSRRYGNLGR